MKSLKYQTTTDAIDRMHSGLHKLREGTTSVRVSVADLKALLADHASMSQLVREDA